MDEELKKQLEEANKTLTALQTEMKQVSADKKSFEDKFNALSNESKERVDKIKADLDAKDADFQKKQLEIAAHETKIKHLEESLSEMKKNNDPANNQRLKDLENEIARLSNLSPADAKGKKGKVFQGKEYEALSDYVMKGIAPEAVINIGKNEQIPTDKKYLRTDSNADGGFLVPEELYNQIMEEVEEIDPVRALCRKFASKVKSLSVAIRSTLPTAYYEGEAETDAESEASYREETLTAYRLGLTSKVTWDSLNFSMADMISQLTKDASMGIAIKENYCFLLGSGNKQPQGILSNTTVNTTNAITSAGSGAVSLVDVIGLLKYLKAGYLPNARFAMNQNTLYTLRTELDTAGNFLWRPGGETMPNQIAGKPFVIMPSMANVGANSLSVLLGDFFYGYYILDAVGISLIRDDLTSKRNAIVEFTFKQWNTGQVAIAEAFRALKTKA